MATAPSNLLIQPCPPVRMRDDPAAAGPLGFDKAARGVKRRHLVELEDLPWWPRVFRDAATDYLVTALRHTGTYTGLVPRLAAALKRTGTTRITDLCSGGGGPWADLLPALRRGRGRVPVPDGQVPQHRRLREARRGTPGVRYEADPVSATDVPPHLAGFRTVFTAFHHFRPAEARAILAAAVRDRQGIAVAEATSRTPAALAMMLLVPLAVWVLTPAIRPFRWSRLFWTYVVPVVPSPSCSTGSCPACGYTRRTR